MESESEHPYVARSVESVPYATERKTHLGNSLKPLTDRA